jgi:hypothetical protein
MDITSAFIIAISRGSTATRLLQFVASGLLGTSAFQGGTTTAVIGLALHFLIALGVVSVFYFASHFFPIVRRWAIPAGILYGLVVYAVMNLIVLPLSAAKPRHTLNGDLIQIGIHMFVIGLPTALLIRRLSRTNAPSIS